LRAPRAFHARLQRVARIARVMADAAHHNVRALINGDYKCGMLRQHRAHRAHAARVARNMRKAVKRRKAKRHAW